MHTSLYNSGHLDIYEELGSGYVTKSICVVLSAGLLFGPKKYKSYTREPKMCRLVPGRRELESETGVGNLM